MANFALLYKCIREGSPLQSETTPAPQRMKMRKGEPLIDRRSGGVGMGGGVVVEQKAGGVALEAAWLPHRPLLLHRHH